MTLSPMLHEWTRIYRVELITEKNLARRTDDELNVQFVCDCSEYTCCKYYMVFKV